MFSPLFASLVPTFPQKRLILRLPRRRLDLRLGVSFSFLSSPPLPSPFKLSFFAPVPTFLTTSCGNTCYTGSFWSSSIYVLLIRFFVFSYFSFVIVHTDGLFPKASRGSTIHAFPVNFCIFLVFDVSSFQSKAMYHGHT